MSVERAGATYSRIVREDLKKYIGAFLEIWPEMNHVTIFYAFNPARGDPQKCTSCGRDNPIVVRHERDHNAREFYDVFCNSCTPKRVVEKLSQG